MSGARFGTFGGVFTPCVLTILGVIMFLRFGQVVGNAGVIGAVLIVLAAKSITTLTSLSLSSISTNSRVRAGGAYFLISRSLGPEFGGAIGLVFFLAQAISVSMYVIGFTETLLATSLGEGFHPLLTATCVNLVVFACVYIGAGWTIRMQYWIVLVLGLAIVSFLIGGYSSASFATLKANLGSSYSPGENWLTMFALFFPASTGIMAGANMSGDLKDPGRSIPRGTLSAILVTGVVYLIFAILLGAVTDRGTLRDDALVVRSVAWSGPLILAGIYAATLSSALGSMMGAPRILQALARDDLFPALRTFGAASRSGEPRRAILLTFVIAQIGIAIGDLNAVAPVITMFFMITYGFLNLATFYETVARNPSYRPTFRYCHWSLSLLGAIGCAAAMVLMSPTWAVISVLMMAGLIHWIGRRELEATFGDAKSGAAFERARKSLMRLERERYHPKNWRPSILVLSGRAGGRAHLTAYGYWLAGGRGLLTLAQVIVGDTAGHIKRRGAQEAILRKYIRDEELDAFPVVVVAPSLSFGIEATVQCHGIGALRPNLVLIGYRDDLTQIEEFGAILRTLITLQRSVVVARTEVDDNEVSWLAPPGPIDIWWRAEKNGSLMLLLAHLLVQNATWRGREVRVIRVVRSEEGIEETAEFLRSRIAAARINAAPVVLVSEDPFLVLRSTSRASALVMLGFDPPEEGMADLIISTRDLVYGLKNVLFVHSAGEADIEA